MSTAAAADGSASAVHQYEYRWSVCYPPPEPRSGLSCPRVFRRHELAQPALHVVLLFAVEPQWRVMDDAAAVRHLAPFRTETAWRKRLADDWNALAPVLGAATGLAADAAGQPELAPVAKRIAAVKATSVPPSDKEESNWFVRSVHSDYRELPYTGVEWVLGRDLLAEIGERVTGSLLVRFTTTKEGQGERPSVRGLAPSGAILRGTVHLQHEKDIRLPQRPAADHPEYLECAVRPVADTPS